jgi:hypothetical protein
LDDRWAADAGRSKGLIGEEADPFQIRRPSIRSLLRLPRHRGSIAGMTMNTAVARRLALGDCVVWIGDDADCCTGLGTITRITAHAVEVRWDGRTTTRYRRAQLHHLRHAKLVSETLDSAQQAA